MLKITMNFDILATC